MNNAFSGFSKVFSFTFARQTKGKTYRGMTIALALVCLLLPVLILSISAAVSGREPSPVEYALPARAVLVNEADYVYDTEKASALSGVEISEAADAGQALETADPQTLVVVLTRTQSETVAFSEVEAGGGCLMRVIRPEGCALSKDEAANFAYALHYALFSLDALDVDDSAILPVRVADAEQEPEPDEMDHNEDTENEGDVFEGVRDVLSFVLPYLNIMVLYFLILIYGQGVANSVIMEKTSKLMDSFLIAVRPPAMVLGKVLAICLAAILQFACWLVALLAGFALGGVAAGLVNPASGAALITKALFSNLHVFSSIFSIPGLIVGLLIILAGFLLYCSLAAVGGALAGKPEDLASTNMLFTLALVVSFFLTLYSGGMSGDLAYTSWLNYFPFSAVMTAPGLAALGRMPIGSALLSLFIILLCALAVMYAAGRIYRNMAFYRGDPPKINRIVAILREKQ